LIGLISTTFAQEETKKEEKKSEAKEKAAKVVKKQASSGPAFATDFGNEFSVELAPLVSFTDSNATDVVENNLMMLGSRLDVQYYGFDFLWDLIELDFFQQFSFLKEMIGVSLDYHGLFVKLSGDENINFTTHRFNLSLRGRFFLLKEKVNKYNTTGLILGGKLNFHLFQLINAEEKGAYGIENIIGPSLGFFASDTVVYHFVKNDLFSKMGLECDANILPLFSDDGAGINLEYYIGAFYIFEAFKFGAGVRSYSFMVEDINEGYFDIVLNAAYRF
jgi:hypothetical protein